MKKFTVLFAMLALCCSGVWAQDRIAAFIENANLYAAADLSDFHKRLSAEYKVKDRVLNECYKHCGNDWGNVGVILEIARATGKTPDVVCNRYEQYRKHGWGRILKEAGISPNSNEYKKFCDRIDDRCKSWKESHEDYCNRHPQYQKKDKRQKDKYDKPKKNKDKGKLDKKRGKQWHGNKD